MNLSPARRQRDAHHAKEIGLRKIINSTYITLDGVIQNPQNWPSSDIADDTGGIIQNELLLGCDALLMGRHTYDSLAAVWPTRSGDPISDRINSMSKYVVSSTLRNPEWNNTSAISVDPMAQISRLKQEPGMDIVQYGFGRLSYALMHHGLLDELRLWVHPLFIGSGGPQALMYREGPTTRLRFVDARPLKTGDVILTYRLAQKT
jgi:dihydrofolate reductase